MKSPMVYRVFVVCLWTGRAEVRLVRGLAAVREIESLFQEFEWIGVEAEPAPLAYLKLSATPVAA